MAVGLSIDESHLEEFTNRLINAVDKQIGKTIREPVLEVDTFIKHSALNHKLLEEVELLAPFGQANAEPIFGIKKIRLNGRPRKVGTGHFQFSIHNGEKAVSGIAWRMADNIPPEDVDLDVAVRLQWNNWNQRKNLQMVLESWRIHKAK